ncbi:hypothetical protein RJ55_05125 [Drechmeria coniospora]|nr:hypothetical protein RJ55_05125 [Drechmeria coniospora]
MLPDPALTLTIPSLYDGTTLDCRIYHPASLAATNAHAAPWNRHAAVFAHPYAPMGGSYDDGIVEVVASQLLRTGYLVGTFNFRGAGHSAGRTSWTAKPEIQDYASAVGFVVYYVQHLDPFRPTSSPETRARFPVPSLLMGGYSYGAMVTAHLPPLCAILEPFESPLADTYPAQIRLRAEHLAEQQNEILGSMRAAVMEQYQNRQELHPRHLKTHRGSVRIGGDEGGSSRKSHESTGRRSFSLDAEDRLRRGVGELLAKRRTKHHPRRSTDGSEQPTVATISGLGSSPAVEPANEVDTKLPKRKNMVAPRAAYLLVSPLQGLVMHLATMEIFPSAITARRHHQRKHETAVEGREGRPPAEMKLVQNPTLAVYGDKDIFVSAGKLRAWVAKLTAPVASASNPISTSKFRAHEVETAGHFWVEEGVLPEMKEAIGRFAASVRDLGADDVAAAAQREEPGREVRI